MARYHEAKWVFRNDYRSLIRIKAGEYEEGVEREIDKEIYSEEIPSLIQALESNGLLKPRLDERLRTEDLKITHRLMDLLDKAITKV